MKAISVIIVSLLIDFLFIGFLYPQVAIVNNCGEIEDGYCNAVGGGKCYYIDPKNGNDNNPGTFEEPWRTMVNINQSIYAGYRPSNWVGLSPGDVLYLMEGVHNTIYHPGDDGGADGGGSYILYMRGLHGTEESPVVIRNYPRHHAILDPEGGGIGIYILQSSNIHVQGLEVRNAYGRGLLLSSSQNIAINNLLIGNTDGTAADNVAGMEIQGSREIEVYNSIFYDNYDRTAAQNNTQTHNSGNLVLFSNQGLISIHNNIFFQNGDSYGQYSGFGIKYKHSSGDPGSVFELYANYFENHKYVHIGVGTHHAFIHHNIINSGSGVAVSSQDWGGTTHQQFQEFRNNTVYGTTGFHMSPTLNWVDHNNGPWDDVTNNSFTDNVVYDTNANYHQEKRTVLLGTYMSDLLYLKLRNGINIDSNCYYNPNIAVSFGFAESVSYGELGGFYDLDGWREVYGWDQNSYETDPIFADAANGDFSALAPVCTGKGALTGEYQIKTEKVYYVLGIDTSQETSADVRNLPLPQKISLSQNYPNPFNPNTVISYKLKVRSEVELKIYDILGREIDALVNEVKNAGDHAVEWNGTNSAGHKVGSGVYFYQLKTGNGFFSNKKMLLIK
ncbi:MAG: T9SS type A sorting domain-containing protein [Bacteroidetes bacterium]|nr:T9SS type A sorting domain-containing protein [Bacteroidota bacterium]